MTNLLLFKHGTVHVIFGETSNGKPRTQSQMKALQECYNRASTILNFFFFEKYGFSNLCICESVYTSDPPMCG